MTEATKLPIKTDTKTPAPRINATWRPFEELRREIDKLFEDFGHGGWTTPFRRMNVDPLFRAVGWNTPAVDISEKGDAFEITAELPGLEAKDVTVTVQNGSIVLKGEKQEETTETSKDYHLQERHYGSFERSFKLPESIDINKIAASFKNGVLSISMLKSVEAQKPAKSIEIKAA